MGTGAAAVGILTKCKRCYGFSSSSSRGPAAKFVLSPSRLKEIHKGWKPKRRDNTSSHDISLPKPEEGLECEKAHFCEGNSCGAYENEADCIDKCSGKKYDSTSHFCYF